MFRFISYIVILSIYLILFTGCTVKETPSEINLIYESSVFSNYYNNKSHSLILIIYQLKRIDTFKTLSQSQEGVEKLLKNKSFDNNFITSHKVVVMPHEKKNLDIEKLEDAKYIGIIAGFYDNSNLRMISKTFSLPIKRKYLFFGEEYIDNIKLDLRINENSLNGEVIE